MKVGYVRVSTVEQNEDRQLKGLENIGIEKWYVEKVSGKNRNRPEFQKMMSEVKEGDIVYVHALSRLARNARDLLNIQYELQEKGVDLVSNKESIDTTTPVGRAFFGMLAVMNQFEREVMLERQAEAIAVAKEKGTYRHRGDKKIDVEIFDENYSLFIDGNLTKIEFAKKIGVSRPTLDKILKKREGEMSCEHVSKSYR